VGHGTTGDRYTHFFRAETDRYVAQFVETLRQIDEYYNKLIVLTTDHGHTNMVDVEDDLAPCAVLPQLEFVDVDGEAGDLARQRERLGNANLSAWELAAVFHAINKRLPLAMAAFRARLLVPGKVLDLLGVETSTATSLDDANIIAALNGPITHVYVRNRVTGSFATAPALTSNDEPAELALVAEFLRLALTPNASSQFLPFTSEQLGNIQDVAGRMRDSVDFILYRPEDGGAYRIFDGLDANGAVRSRGLEQFFAEPPNTDRFIRPIERIRAMNDPNRSGDLVVHFRFGPSQAVIDRYTAGTSCRAWHGSLETADSYVPMIVAYPGGNTGEFLRWFNDNQQSPPGDPSRVCKSVDAQDPSLPGNFDCHGNWMTTDLIRELLRELYAPRSPPGESP
jgi:hypothetical protein